MNGFLIYSIKSSTGANQSFDFDNIRIATQETKTQIAGKKTENGKPKGWIFKNRWWIGGLIVGLIILVLSIIAHKNGYL